MFACAAGQHGCVVRGPCGGATAAAIVSAPAESTSGAGSRVPVRPVSPAAAACDRRNFTAGGQYLLYDVNLATGQVTNARLVAEVLD